MGNWCTLWEQKNHGLSFLNTVVQQVPSAEQYSRIPDHRIYSVSQKKEPIFFCVHLFQYLTKTGGCFSYILRNNDDDDDTLSAVILLFFHKKVENSDLVTFSYAPPRK